MAFTISKELFKKVAYDTCKAAVIGVAEDCIKLLKQHYEKESDSRAKKILETMIKNAEAAEELGKTPCQSPGYPVAYVTIGRGFLLDVNVKEILADVLRTVTEEGYLRPSIVHPFTRKNTGNNFGENVPDIEIYHDNNLEYVELVFSFKGCGAELFNAFKVFKPADIGKNAEGIKKFILETVINAGGGPCPPTAIGVGIGGQIHQAAKLSRRAVSIRRWDDINPNPELAALEKELIEKVNSLGIGAAGVGGDTTCLTVKVEWAYTHTAILPVAVNFHCWVARRARARIYPNGEVKILKW